MSGLLVFMPAAKVLILRRHHLAKRPEPGANLFDKQLWLLPCGEVPAPVEPVEMDEHSRKQQL
jgi:hypothetical protein